jgi:hypothetical protein
VAFTQPRKVEIWSFIKARIRIRFQTPGSDFKGPDLTGSGSAILRVTVSFILDLAPEFWLPVPVEVYEKFQGERVGPKH